MSKYRAGQFVRVAFPPQPREICKNYPLSSCFVKMSRTLLESESSRLFLTFFLEKDTLFSRHFSPHDFRIRGVLYCVPNSRTRVINHAFSNNLQFSIISTNICTKRMEILRLLIK